MRDKLIHGYFGVDLDVVWNTVTEDLPALRTPLATMFEVVSTEETIDDEPSNVYETTAWRVGRNPRSRLRRPCSCAPTPPNCP